MNSLLKKRSGYTLIEILVAVAVICLLTVLVLSAVQAARESARRAECANNLHQLGIALASYASSFGSLPGSGNGNGFSPQVMILPFLDQRPVYDAINFGEVALVTDPGSRNYSVHLVAVSTFLCPSAAPLPYARAGGTDYAGSRGVDFRDSLDNGAFNGRSATPVRYQDFTDGTSTTVVMAEWIKGPGVPSARDPLGTVFDTPGNLIGSAAFDRFNVVCKGLDTDVAKPEANDKGFNWLFGGYRHCIYNHNLMINGHSCTNQGAVQEGAYSAGSRHSGGANVLFADGHTRFVRDDLALNIWRAMGTRCTGDFVSD